jgi:hypothetical protein
MTIEIGANLSEALIGVAFFAWMAILAWAISR